MRSSACNLRSSAATLGHDDYRAGGAISRACWKWGSAHWAQRLFGTCTDPAGPRPRPVSCVATASPSPSWGDDASSGGPCVARWWSVSCSRASSSGLTLGLSRAQRCDSAHHIRSTPSARRWSTDALTTVRIAASRMCSHIGFPHFWQALWGGDQLPLPCPWCSDGGAVGRGLAFAGCTVFCRERSVDETLLWDWRALGLRRRTRTRTRGLCRVLSAARSARTSLPASRGHSTIRARASQYPVVGVVPFVITVDHDDNRGEPEVSGAVRRPKVPAGQSLTEDRGSVVMPATGCG